MQLRLLPAMIVFLGSYLPLSLIMLVQSIDYKMASAPACWPLLLGHCELPLPNPHLAIGSVVATLLCFIATLAVLGLVKPKQGAQVSEAKYIPTDMINYTLPYIVSFMGLNYQETGKLLGFLVFLGWMFWISYRSGQIILNPVLIVLSWRLYEITYQLSGGANPQSSWALVKGDLAPGQHRMKSLQSLQIIKP